MKIAVAAFFALVIAGAVAQEPTPSPKPTVAMDPWVFLRRLEGTWRGTGQGEPGTSTVQRTYEFVLRKTFLQARQMGTYAPQEKNPKGEVHEDWGLYSYDKQRRVLVLRQFHVEGFVDQYVAEIPTGDSVVFTTEAIENLPAKWRARETLRLIGDAELLEVFELAPPGKDFSTYSETRLGRVKP